MLRLISLDRLVLYKLESILEQRDDPNVFTAYSNLCYMFSDIHTRYTIKDIKDINDIEELALAANKIKYKKIENHQIAYQIIKNRGNNW
jgi:hypothetical protein